MSWKRIAAVFVGSLVGMVLAAPLMDWSHMSLPLLFAAPLTGAAIVAVVEAMRVRRRLRNAEDGRE